MRILIHSDPYPQSQAPRFVKEAYQGLVLEVVAHFEGIPELSFDDFYTVSLAELLSKMKLKSELAYEWLRLNGELLDHVARNSPGQKSIAVVFPSTCCSLASANER